MDLVIGVGGVYKLKKPVKIMEPAKMAVVTLEEPAGTEYTFGKWAFHDNMHWTPKDEPFHMMFSIIRSTDGQALILNTRMAEEYLEMVEMRKEE